MSTTIRISEATQARLASLARSTGRPMTRLVDDAVDALERRIFFQDLNQRYGELRAASDAWSEIDAERSIEEGAVKDSSHP